jgi:hypothetical protein
MTSEIPNNPEIKLVYREPQSLQPLGDITSAESGLRNALWHGGCY